jgi:hypothetical protein
VCQLIYHEIQVKSYQSQRFKEGKPFIQGDFLNSNMCWCCFERCQIFFFWIFTCDNQNVKIQKDKYEKVFSCLRPISTCFKDIFQMKLSSKKHPYTFSFHFLLLELIGNWFEDMFFSCEHSSQCTKRKTIHSSLAFPLKEEPINNNKSN